MSDAHSGNRLQALAAQRRIGQANVVAISCGRCGAATHDPALAFALGFGHLPECMASDQAIHFITKAAPVAASPPKPTSHSRPYRIRRPGAD